MRILGIVGGIGPESTIDYYRRFIDTWRERGPAGTYPHLIIDNVEGGEVVRLLGEGEFGRVAAILSVAMDQLTSAGAGAAMIASNATHLALEGARASSAIPLIHIVDVTAEAANRRGFRRVGLIGTRFVMRADLYPKRFAPLGIEVITPHDAEQDEVHHIYMNELLQGVVRDASRERLVSLIDRLRERDGIEAVVLGARSWPSSSPRASTPESRCSTRPRSTSTPASTGSWRPPRPPGELPDRVGRSLVADA
jgi:aspartate racemase